MTRRLGRAAAVIAALAGALVVTPAEAAPKTLEGTIAIPGHEPGNALLGYSVAGSVPTKQVCPGPGPLDGVTYKFFDLKGLYRSFKLTGPPPVVKQEVPVYGGINEYDLDILGFDEKCELIAGAGSTSGRTQLASENFRPKKPVRFIAVKYYAGPYPNVPFRVEYS